MQGKQYTSARKASRMVQRGIAVWIAAHVIRLVAGAPQFTSRPDWQDEQIDASIARYCAGGIVNWAGCEPWKQCLPGAGHAYQRPDRVR